MAKDGRVERFFNEGLVQKNGWHPIVSFPSILDSSLWCYRCLRGPCTSLMVGQHSLEKHWGNLPFQYLAHTSGLSRLFSVKD